jgi:hypothetical protein
MLVGRVVHRVLVRKAEERDHWGDRDIIGRIIFRRIFRKREEVVWTECICVGKGTGGGYL